LYVTVARINPKYVETQYKSAQNNAAPYAANNRQQRKLAYIDRLMSLEVVMNVRTVKADSKELRAVGLATQNP